MSSVLGVHVLGQGFGESVVLEMPNGAVGVIDCFAAQLKASTREERLEANPTLRFLIEELQAERLAFVAFSHPHEDHGRGLSHLLEEFRGRIGEIWVFRAFASIDLERHMMALLCSGRSLDIEDLRNEPVGTFTRELSKVKVLILDLTRNAGPNGAAFRYFAGYRRFTVNGEPLVFHMIGPTDRLVAEYEQALAGNMAGLVDDTGEHVNPNWQPDRVNHNRVSAALVVEYNKTRVVLGADMETDAWASVLREIDSGTEYDLPLGCHLVKVSHHGSMTGHCEGLYECRFARPGHKKPLAVLTPFNRHRNPLPSAEGMDHLLARTKLVFSTNRAEAYHASERLPPDFVAFQEGEGQVTIPLAWARDLIADPALRGALVPSESEGAEVLPTPKEVPLTWRHDLIANPRLARLLRPEVRRLLITEQELRNAVTETECRVSFYFNDRGMELKARRYIGSRAGQLA
jgi:hypothetical protein